MKFHPPSSRLKPAPTGTGCNLRAKKALALPVTFISPILFGMLQRKNLASVALALLVLLGLAACGSEPAAKPEPTRIVFVTDWKAQAEHGGFYEALAEGLYAKHGLSVTIREGGAAVNVGQLLAGHAADFGIASNNFIPLNLRQAGGAFKAVMAVFQKDPQVLIT